MIKEQLLEYINLFREKAEKSKLIIFVGAGVSCNVEGMPSWYTLVKKMAQTINYSKCSSCKCKKEGCTDSCLLLEDFSTDEFLKIPQYVYNRDTALYNQVLNDNLPNIVADVPLSSAIFDVNPVHIITTNYDKLLESSQNVFCEQYQVVVHDRDLLNAEKSKYIIKMHGDLLQPESIVLKEQDYLDYSQKHILIELFIKSLLTDHTVLFLGYSLNDYNIKLIISWLNYMRSQNNPLSDDQKVGYIVLDDDQISDTQISYFAGNNIGVININGMPQINNIPVSLSDDKGKRLYSFLKVIADTSLEEGLSSIENSVNLMSHHTFVDYQQILKLLYVEPYEKTEAKLRLFSEDQYTRLVRFMSLGNLKSSQLKQLFINAGVLMISVNSEPEKQFNIGAFSEHSLLQDELYNFYIENKYGEMKALLENETDDLDKKYFYQSIISGYNVSLSDYDKTYFSTLSLDRKVAYLNNCAVLDIFESFKFDSSKATHFIENISPMRERNLLSLYIDLYNGNAKKTLGMKTSLDKLKKDVGETGKIFIGRSACSELYKIKNMAMTQYFFYYLNHVFYKGLSDTNAFFNPYIEAIICANSELAEEKSHGWGFTSTNVKYFIGFIDFDIITKFISTKDLSELLSAYKIIRLNTSEENVLFLASCFANLCNSLVDAKIYGFRRSSFSVLANLAMLLNLVDLSDDCTKLLETSIVKLFDDDAFDQLFFSVHCPERGSCLKAISSLCKLFHLASNTEIVEKIINCKDFFEYAVNVNFNTLRGLTLTFLPDNNIVDVQTKIKDMIDATNDFYHKVILLRLVYRRITDAPIKDHYRAFLSSNFALLDVQTVYDFVFNDWLVPSQEGIGTFLNEMLEIQRKQSNGVHFYPDPVETKLECVYLLYSHEFITDISMLKDMADGREHLQFLLDPETFDYTLIDFSNYMWVNFAKREKYMKRFIAHKDEIIPRIKERLNRDNASEDEKTILYGFLLNDNEVWEF